MSSLTSHLVTRDPERGRRLVHLGARRDETSRITLPGGQVLTIELRFGDSALAISDEFPDMGVVSPLTLGGTYGALHLAVDGRGRGVAAGPGRRGDRVRAAARRVLGERTGQFIDPFGHRWAVDQHLADVPHEEVVRLAAEAFGGGQG